ncbi:hypothetical protein EYF80_016266 [Liparis tanakae]|uniref:Uncharacterized protein n=1 Tax=Liparis tanakae TaxID=230148 RepID=A0A4Z2I612_9TELE|nr:hypothetical protein EYF80_016266 [Liparis tanakae]
MDNGHPDRKRAGRSAPPYALVGALSVTFDTPVLHVMHSSNPPCSHDLDRVRFQTTSKKTIRSGEQLVWLRPKEQRLPTSRAAQLTGCRGDVSRSYSLSLVSARTPAVIKNGSAVKPFNRKRSSGRRVKFSFSADSRCGI